MPQNKFNYFHITVRFSAIREYEDQIHLLNLYVKFLTNPRKKKLISELYIIREYTEDGESPHLHLFLNKTIEERKVNVKKTFLLQFTQAKVNQLYDQEKKVQKMSWDNVQEIKSEKALSQLIYYYFEKEKIENGFPKEREIVYTFITLKRLQSLKKRFEEIPLQDCVKQNAKKQGVHKEIPNNLTKCISKDLLFRKLIKQVDQNLKTDQEFTLEFFMDQLLLLLQEFRCPNAQRMFKAYYYDLYFIYGKDYNTKKRCLLDCMPFIATPLNDETYKLKEENQQQALARI